MKLYAALSFTFVLVGICPSGIVAPFPKCSPLRFINKMVEANNTLWLWEGLPGEGSCFETLP